MVVAPGRTGDEGPLDGRAAVLAVVGPTAAGKSAVVMAAAADDPRVEVVAVDAFTVYRGMDVGTAKPSAADRAAVTHHCIDLLEPTELVDVAWFRDRARTAIAGVHARGGVPVLVGGSGLYFRAVVDDMRFPPTDEATRRRLELRWADRSAEAHATLVALDPAAAASIEPGNLRRTVRALEVIELTGQPFSAWSGTPHRSVVGDLVVVHLDPPREVLRDRIGRRTDAMLDHGLVAEAAELRRRHGTLSRTARQAIGYAEAFAVLDGDLPGDGLADAVSTRTWGYARRQRSWFGRDPRGGDPARDHREALARVAAALAAIPRR